MWKKHTHYDSDPGEVPEQNDTPHGGSGGGGRSYSNASGLME